MTSQSHVLAKRTRLVPQSIKGGQLRQAGAHIMTPCQYSLNQELQGRPRTEVGLRHGFPVHWGIQGHPAGHRHGAVVCTCWLSELQLPHPPRLGKCTMSLWHQRWPHSGHTYTERSHEDNQREAREPSTLKDITSEPNSGRCFMTHPPGRQEQNEKVFFKTQSCHFLSIVFTK